MTHLAPRFFLFYPLRHDSCLFHGSLVDLRAIRKEAADNQHIFIGIQCQVVIRLRLRRDDLVKCVIHPEPRIAHIASHAGQDVERAFRTALEAFDMAAESLDCESGKMSARNAPPSSAWSGVQPPRSSPAATR